MTSGEEKYRTETGDKPDFNRKWLVAMTVGTAVFLATLDGSIVNVSLPTMVASLGTNFAVIQWVVLGYLLTVTSLTLGFGRLGDILGKKSVYLAGLTIFTAASALCGLSSHVLSLIMFRVVQGVGAAMTMALGPAILTEAFPPEERGKAMGIIGAVVSIGIIAGPALGGMIIHFMSWHWIFFVNIPIGIAGILMVQRFVPNLRPSFKQKFDYVGAAILLVSLFSLLMGLSMGQRQGFTELPVFLLLSTFLVSTVAFILVELRIDQPMVDLSLFQKPLLCVNLVTGFVTYIAVGGFFILLPFYLEGILGYPTFKVGLFMCVIPIMMGISAPVSGALSDRLGSRSITLLGLTVLLLGFLASATLTTETGEFRFIMRILGIGIGAGLFISPNNSAIMGAGDRGRLGVASGLMTISRTLGQTVGVSIIGALWAVRVRTLVGDWTLEDVTEAPLLLQVKGLQFIFVAVAVMIFFGLCISIFGYLLEKKSDLKVDIAGIFPYPWRKST